LINDLYAKYLKLTGEPDAAATLVLAHVNHQSTSTFLTPQQAADELGISLQKVYMMCEAGELRCTRIGRLIRILPEDLQKITPPNVTPACFR